MTSAPPLVVIAGATATGKTALAIELAETIRDAGRAAEIISADSRQVFRGLDIGTAKATAAEQALVPHHGIDLVEPDQPFSVAEFLTHVAVVLADIAAHEGVAILAGGTGLYVRAVARGIDTDALPSERVVRARLEAELIAEGLPVLVERLEAVAPQLATKIDLRNPRRVVRALEIAELVGDGPRPPARGYPGSVTWIGLHVQPEVHAQRVTARARAQFAAGLAEEADALRDRYDQALPAFTAFGYHEAWAYLDGDATLEEAIVLDAQRTVAFSKRQRTWFRSEVAIEWLDATERLPVEEALEALRSARVARGVR